MQSESVRIGSEMMIENQPDSTPLQFEQTSDIKALCASALLKRTIEHNIRVLSSYYTQIRTSRAAEMLGLSVSDIEAHLAELSHPMSAVVISKSTKVSGETTEDEELGRGGSSLFIRINRPDGIVSFCKPQTAEATLSDWASGVTGLLTLMESTCHLINRENMVYKV